MANEASEDVLDAIDALSVEPLKEKKNRFLTQSVFIVLAIATTIFGLYFLSRYNYLLFHGVVEVYTVVIAFAIFVIAWNSRRMLDNNYLLFIGIAFLFVGGIDLLHMLTYRGMGIFPGISSNWATQLWLATRYLLSLSLLAALFFIHRKIRPNFVFAVYSVVTGLLLCSILYWKIFPTAYVDGVGLTSFKVDSEYVIFLIFLSSMVFLLRKRREFSGEVVKLIVAATAVAAASELAFTLYMDVYGVANMIGHLLTVVAFYLIYKAFIETGLNKPYNLLFRNLKQSEMKLENRAAELTTVNNKLEAEIAEREAIENALRESQEHLRLKLDSVLSPDVDIGEQELANILDVAALQSMMNYLFAVTQIGFTVSDLKGNILISTGWQDICTNFHRINPQTLKNCLESDLNLSSGVKAGEFRAYKCKNGLWDIVTPIVIGGKHVGNVYSGQFFFEDEDVDRNLFAANAAAFGFDKKAYLDALDKVPRWNRAKVEDLMVFYTKLAEMISKLSYSNLKLAKSLHNQRELQERLEEKAAEVEEYATRMEELAEERARKLKDAERLAAIGQTAGMVGHDIRNPLQAISSELYLERLEVESLPDGDAKHNLLDSIVGVEENLLYINKIVADLQDFARPLTPKKESVNIEKALEESLGIVTIPEEVEVSIFCEAGLPFVTADSTMLKRVFVNLIQNAVQAMPKGGKLKVAATLRNHSVTVAVEDTGEGIPDDVKDKLFTPLFTTKSKGQGLGLAVVKRLVDVQNGNITFESKLGVGTKFIVEFHT